MTKPHKPLQCYNILTHPICGDDRYIVIAGTEHGIERVLCLDEESLQNIESTQDIAFAADAYTWIGQFLDGMTRTSFPLPGLPHATPFQLRCLQAIHAIPYGTTITYSELAKKAGRPAAIRAAASVCATNPIPLLIPCHRVVNKQRGLSGFAWGVPVKERLLSLEQRGVRRAA